MKTKLFLLCGLFVAIFAVGVVVYSCSTEPFDFNPEPEFSIEVAGIPAEYAVIGAEHNNAVEFAFQAIREVSCIKTRSGSEQKFSKKDLLKLSELAVNDFVKENHYFGADAAMYREVMSKSQGKSLSLTRSGMDEAGYSPELQQFLKRLGDAIFHVKVDGIKHLKREIEILVAEAQQTLGETELVAFYAGASTACASMAYWVGNHQKWQIALNNPELLLVYSDEELNDLEFKNEQLISGGMPMTRGWWEDAWSKVGETWDSISDSFNEWWNDSGKTTVTVDAGAAAAGALEAAAGGAVGGPVGVAVAAAVGGISVGASASIGAEISSWLED